ncbi:MAG: hypothetical protein AAB112_06115, partial [Thermodesulfobacteriota bacterium]
MEYKSGIASRSRRKGRKSTGIRTVLLLFTAAGLAALLFYPEKVRAIAEGWIRIQNTFSFIVLDRKPETLLLGATPN